MVDRLLFCFKWSVNQIFNESSDAKSQAYSGTSIERVMLRPVGNIFSFLSSLN